MQKLRITLLNTLNTMKLFSTLLLLFICATYTGKAQSDFVQRNDVQVSANGQNMKFPWIGGLNNPQFSEVDLNGDGTMDLFIFDRGADKVFTFINNGTPNTVDYEYQPEYERAFPTMKFWAKLVDFNCDGVMDIFCSYDLDGIQVWEGYRNETNKIAFNLFIEKLDYEENGSTKNLAVAVYDLPEIKDIDDDGDIDILTFNTSGGYIDFFENQAAENECGVLSFEVTDACWGNFYESGVDAELDLGIDCSDGLAVAIASEEKSLHPGSTLLAIDLDGDLDKEIILGDISFDNLVMAVNGGDLSNANMIEQDINFPSYSVPALPRTFPAAFSLDVNNDGLKDMLVSPNARNQSQHRRCVWFYENNGNEENQFDYQTETFLIDDMIDVNRYSYPAFFDHNSDGLLDLVVANYGYMNNAGTFTAALSLYENTGTATNPAFTLIDDDYIEIFEQLAFDYYSFTPTFGDIDGDGDEDMIVGTEEGFLHLFINTPNGEGIAQFGAPQVQEQYQGLDIVQHSTPNLFDVNEDGLLDLVVGHRNGEIRYLENTGTDTNPVFTQQSTFWGEIDVQEQGGVTGFSVPKMLKVNGDLVLVVGAENGKIHLYRGIEGNILTGAFTLVNDNLLGLDIGYNAAPAIADLDNDGMLDIIVGSYNGGLVWFEQAYSLNTQAIVKNSKKVHVYPNPSTNFIQIDVSSLNNASIKNVNIYDLTGRLVMSKKVLEKKQQITMDTKLLTTGLYLAQILIDDQVYSQKMVVKD